MIRIIFVGKSKEPWLRGQINEYVKRLGAFCRLQVEEVKDEKVMGRDYEQIKKKEGDRILKILDDDYVIGLDAGGQSLESAQFAKALEKAAQSNRKITFVVGGALGLSDDLLKRCNMKLSLSRMTFTNQMVRLILVEQIYRAFTISAGMQYHK
jgi:23S rRNA (pseudouridine1915-N3)-methyltransferase